MPPHKSPTSYQLLDTMSENCYDLSTQVELLIFMNTVLYFYYENEMPFCLLIKKYCPCLSFSSDQ